MVSVVVFMSGGMVIGTMSEGELPQVDRLMEAFAVNIETVRGDLFPRKISWCRILFSRAFILPFSFAVGLSTVHADFVTATRPRYDIGSWWSDGASWSDGMEPTADKSYLIDLAIGYKADGTTGGAIRLGDSTPMCFTGGTLQIGQVGSSKTPYIVSVNSQPLEFPGSETRDGLVLARGAWTSWANSPTMTHIKGRVRVTAPRASRPFSFEQSKSSHSVVLEGSLSGAEDAGLVGYGQAGQTSYNFFLRSDASQYRGEIAFGHSTEMARNAIMGVYLKGGQSLGGHMLLRPQLGRGLFFEGSEPSYIVDRMTVLGPDLKITVNNSGGMAANNVNTRLVVTNAFTYDPDLCVSVAAANLGTLNNWGQNYAGLTVLPFLSVPENSPLTVDNFRPAFTNGNVTESMVFAPRHDIIVTNLVDVGMKTFCLRRRGYVYVESTASCSYDSERPDLFMFAASSPDYAEFDFYNKTDKPRGFYTPWRKKAIYGAKSLTLRNQNNFFVNSGEVVVDDLRLGGGTVLALSENVKYAPSILRGRFAPYTDQWGDTVRVRVGVTTENPSLTLASEIWSDAAQHVVGNLEVLVEDTAPADGTLVLTGENRTWTGRMTVHGSATHKCTVAVANGFALGGPCETFTPGALVLQHGAVLAPSVDGVSLVEPTRGICVSNAQDAAISVPADQTFSIAQTITYEGDATLEKVDAGTLVLGGTSVVASDAQGAFHVAEGWVKPRTADVFAGVKLSCGAAGAFVYDVPADGATGFGETGLIDPILKEGATFRMSVAIAERPTTRLFVPVCTLSSDKVAAFKSAFQFVRTTPNTGCRLIEKVVDGNRVTLIAEVGPVGFMVIFR